MDLNRKYSDHQKAVMRASAAPEGNARDTELGIASALAGQIGDYQVALGAAASCAWNASKRKVARIDAVSAK